MIFSLIYVGIREYFNKYESIYQEDSNIFTLVIKGKNIDGNKVALEFDGVENLVGSYYIENLEELKSLDKELKYGVKVRVWGNLNKPSNNTIPNNFNYNEYLKYKGIYYTLDIDKIEVIDSKTNFIYGVKNIISERILKIDKTGYMKAFILGDKSLIDKNVYNTYQKIGVTHLFALSGMHVGMLSGIILSILKRLNEKWRYLLLDFVLVVYGFIVGFPSSIKRCILFFILNSINKIFNIKLSTLKILLVVVFLLVIYDYRIIYDVGFKYSIMTVIGIAIAEDFINDFNKIRGSFKLSLVAFLFSLPISLCNFYEINLLSVFYNMVFIPFVSLIVYPLSLLSFIFPLFYVVFDFFVMVMEYVSAFISRVDLFILYLDFNLIEVVLFYVILFFVFYKKRIIMLYLLPIIIIIDIFLPYFDSNGYVYFFDVGQGDSSLIISPNRKDVILIDTGGASSFYKEEWMKRREYNVSDGIVSFLKSKGIKKINLLILSHGDEDHAKEVMNIYKSINIDFLKINDGNVSKYEEIALKLIKNKNYKAQGLELQYLNYKKYNDENADSVLTYMKIYDTTILSLGDATSQAEDDLLNKYSLSNIDVLKLSHHGSKTSSSEYFISNVNPRFGIISSGRSNRFNHPSSETISTLNKYKIKYLNTQTSGTIEFVIKKNGVTYNEYKP